MAKKRVEMPDWVHHELLNWARWCWRGAYPHPLPTGHCGSPEWQYQRISEEGTTESVDEKPIPVNEDAAKLVQSVYDGLPHISQQALRAEYPQSREANKVRVRVGREVYEAGLYVAINAVRLAFERCR